VGPISCKVVSMEDVESSSGMFVSAIPSLKVSTSLSVSVNCSEGASGKVSIFSDSISSCGLVSTPFSFVSGSSDAMG